MYNKLLNNESAARYKPHMQAMVEYCYIGKEFKSSRCLKSSRFLGLPLVSNISKISKYEADAEHCGVFPVQIDI
jgi:hypothetical protein